MLLAICVALCYVSSPPQPQSFQDEVYPWIPAEGIAPISFPDLNGDGAPDILYTRTTGPTNTSSSWARNDGAGKFYEHRSLSDNSPGFPLITKAGDMDGDGDLDLISYGGALGVNGVTWRENVGRDVFEGARLISTTTPGFSNEEILEPADLDGDGDVDLLFNSEGDAPAWIENLGGGTFASPAQFAPTGERIQQLDAHDLDGDGRLDAVWITYLFSVDGEMRWARNLGAGQFAPAATVGALMRPREFEFEDLDSDGRKDLVVVDLGIRWLRNLGGGTFAPSELVVDIGSTETFALADFTGNGVMDVVTIGFGMNYLRLYPGTGGGSFLPGIPLDTAVSPFAVQLFTEDLDADGDMDLVISEENALQWRENLDSGNLGAGQTISNQPVGTLVDFDQDGDTDILGTDFEARTVTLYQNVGSAQFQPPTTVVGHVPYPRSAEAADSDGDGEPEVLVSSGSFQVNGAQVWVYGHWTPTLSSGVQIFPTTSNDGTADAEWLDMDGDGDLDVLMTFDKILSPGERSLTWARNDGPAGFIAMPVDPLASTTQLVEVTDLDGDGLADLIGFGNSPSELVWRAGRTDGTFAASVGAGVLVPALAPAHMADLDGDNDLDLLYVDFATREVHASFQTGVGTFAPSQVILTLPQSPITISTVDWDLDGDPDPVLIVGPVPSPFSHGVVFIENLGLGAFGTSTSILRPGIADELVTVDLDGDQDVDLWKWGGPYGGYLLNNARFGDAYCSDSVPNSTGMSARISAEGSPEVSLNDVSLLGSSIPQNAFGYFIIGDAPTFAVAPAGSQGNLCVGGEVGRLNRGPTEIFQAGASGSVSVPLDLTNVPTPTGAVAILPGDTRYFQAWHRDANPSATSNFSNGLAIQFE